jgi:hypothetical protein
VELEVPLADCKDGEGERPIVEMDMKGRLKFRPRRKVVWSRFTSWRVSKEGMVVDV